MAAAFKRELGSGKESSIKKENLKGVIQKPLEILEFLS